MIAKVCEERLDGYFMGAVVPLMRSQELNRLWYASAGLLLGGVHSDVVPTR